MSRVEEALRRARDAAAAGTRDDGDGDQPAPLESVAGTAFAREPFPIEMPERRSHIHAAPRPVTPSPAAGSTDTHVPAPRSHPSGFEQPAESSGSRPERLLDRVDHRLTEKLIIDDLMMPSSREQYRRLAASLHHMQFDGVSVIMITSAVAGEGKTLTASNLALTFSESYDRRVLLVDADLRRPTLHEVFRVRSPQGLADGLIGPEDRKIQVRQLSPRLCFLPAGRPTSDPMACLASGRLKRILAEAKESFDWVIIDTPPVGLLPDASLLSSIVDGAVLVIKAGSTPYDLVRRAVEAVGRDKIVGSVLNLADRDSLTSHRSDYDRYYGSKLPQTT